MNVRGGTGFPLPYRPTPQGSLARRLARSISCGDRDVLEDRRMSGRTRFRFGRERFSDFGLGIAMEPRITVRQAHRCP
jgi:hypothetical protein